MEGTGNYSTTRFRIVGSPEDGQRADLQVRDPRGRPYRTKTITTPAAWALADLVSIKRDLELVIARCGRLLASPEDPDDAVFEAILVAYGRCFTAGKSSRGKGQRRSISALLTEHLSPEDVAVHQRAKDVRNEHLAHRVDANERSRVVMVFDHDGSYIGITMLSLGLRASRELIEELKPVAAKLLAAVNDVVVAESDALRDDHAEAFRHR